MPVYAFTTFVVAPSLDHARIIAAERTGYDEDLGFDYQITGVTDPDLPHVCEYHKARLHDVPSTNR